MALHSDAELSRVPPGKLYPKPEPGLTAPVVHAPESQLGMDAPNNLAAEQPPDIDEPVTRNAESQPDLSAPVNRSAQAQPGINAPVTRAAQAQPGLANPVNRSAQADPGINAPNILTPVAPVSFPDNCGRIGYINLIASYTVSNNAAQAGALLTPSTWERWQSLFGGNAVIDGTLSSDAAVSYVGISGDIGGAEIRVSTSPDLVSAFVEQARLTVPASQVSAMLRFPNVVARRVRISILRTAPVNVAVAWSGPTLTLQRPTRGGVSPANLSRSTSYSNEFSAAGNILGRVINRQGLTTKVDLRNLTDDWYRASFDPFVQAARTRPFFYLWNPRDYPLDCIYGVCSDDIKPTLQGGREMMDVSFDIEGL